MFDFHTPELFDQLHPCITPWNITTITYPSKTTGTNRRCTVILPPHYTEKKTYPVLYLLHGIGGDHKEWLLGNPAEIIANLHAEGMSPEMLVILPNVRAATDDSIPKQPIHPVNIAAFDNFINDLQNDLMPYITANFSVKEGRNNTAIAGLSMGGREALFIGFSMPDTFRFVGAFSPAPGLLPFPELGYPGQFNEATFTLPSSQTMPSFVMICNGEQDDIVYHVATHYAQTLTKHRIPHLYYTMPGGHDFTVWKNGLYHFVRHCFK